MNRADQIVLLKQQRQVLWEEFQKLPRKNTFTGLNLAEGINQIQSSLDRLGDKSERFVCEVTSIESH